MKKIFVILVLLLSPMLAFGADFLSPVKGGDPNITVSTNETYRNLYSAGANVIVNGKVEGDLFSAGGMVNVIGEVEEDVNLAGGTLSLSGVFGGDARLVGGNISITSPISGDLLIAGGNISITEKSVIGGDVVIAGGNVVIEGNVNGSLKMVGGNIYINSVISGPVNIHLSGKKKNEGNLTFGPKAVVMSEIQYKGFKEAVIKDGAKISDIKFTSSSVKHKQNLIIGIISLALVIKFLAWFFAGWLLVKIRKNSLTNLVSSTLEKALENLGMGFLSLIAIPVISLVLLFSLVGYYISGILFLSYLLLLMYAGLLSLVLVGVKIEFWIFKHQNPNLTWKTAIYGSLGLVILKLIPFFGMIIFFGIYLISLGGLFRHIKEKLSKNE